MNTTTKTPPDRIVRVPELLEIVGLTRRAVYALETRGEFPRRLRLGEGPRAPCGWRLSDVMNWIEQRAQAPNAVGDGSRTPPWAHDKTK